MTRAERIQIVVASVVTAGLVGFMVGQANAETKTLPPLPTVTVTATPPTAPSPAPSTKPKPKTKPTPKATPVREVRVSRSRPANATPSGLPSWVKSFRECVLEAESGNWPYDGHPRPYDAVRSDGGTASGAYQFIDSTWQAYSREAGYPGWSRAVHAPAKVQDAVFYWVVLNKGKYPWKGNGCV